MKNILKRIFNKKNIFYLIIGGILICVIVFLLIQINSKKIDERWKTDRITISLADGSTFDLDNKETVTRISRLCNDGIFRVVPDDSKVNGSCEIWIDFNNGTIVGMFLNRDYGYVGDTKQYVGDPVYLPNGLNEFIRNVISNNIQYQIIEGQILENTNLSFLISISDKSKDILDTETVLVSYENLPFSDIKDLDFKIGDNIKVYFNGSIIDTYPPKIYCSKLELVKDKVVEESKTEPILNEDEINQGYESKYYSGQEKKTEKLGTEDNTEKKSPINLKKILLNDTSITSKVPDWVLNESSLDSLYSFNNFDYLIDTIAVEEFSNHYSEDWNEDVLNNMILGQGIKTFNLDSEDVLINYPVVLNGNIIALLEVKESNGNFEVSLTHELVNALNEMKSLTSKENPLILIKTEDVLCGMIEDTIWTEEEINVDKVNFEEISGEVVLNVLEKLVLTEISE